MVFNIVDYFSIYSVLAEDYELTTEMCTTIDKLKNY